jgi:hypothetical protein
MRLTHTPFRRTSPLSVLSLLLNLTILSIFIIASPVLSQSEVPDTPSNEPYSHNFGIEDARKAGLVKPLNLSQTIKGVTVYIHWMYIDAHTAHIRYYIDGNRVTVLRTVKKAGIRGTVGSHSFNCLGGSSSSPDFSAPVTALNEEARCALDEAADEWWLEFDLGSVQTEFPVVLEFNAGGYIIPDPDVPQSRTKTHLQTLTPESTQEPLPGQTVTPPSPDIFRFEFEVTYYPAKILEVNDSQTFGGQEGNPTATVTLQSVSVTPSSTVLNLCSDLPGEMQWMLGNLSFTLNGKMPFTYRGAQFGWRLGETCRGWAFDLFHPMDTPAVIELGFDYLQENDFSAFPTTQSGWDALLPALEAVGIKVNLSPYPGGVGYSEMRVPREGVVEAAMVEAGLWRRIEGEWRFTVTIP